jgi:hypothetical protein
MCQNAIALISNALHSIDNDEKLLKIKGRISLFIQTMDVCAMITLFALGFLTNQYRVGTILQLRCNH